MFLPVSLYIGLRYIRSQRRSHFLSFMALTSILGIGLGVMVLITVLSVMNGFDQEVRTRLLAEVSHVIVMKDTGQAISNWQSLRKKIKEEPDVIDAAPFINSYALLINLIQSSPAIIFGILPSLEKKISVIPKQVDAGNFNLLPGQYTIVLSRDLAEALLAELGDYITLIIPSTHLLSLTTLPKFKKFKIIGIFDTKKSSINQGTAYIHLKDAETLFHFGNNVSGLRLKIHDLYKAKKIADKIMDTLPGYETSTWTDTYGPMMHSIALEKKIMFIVLALLIAISAFTLVSSLTISVHEKQADIAILRTIGATSWIILAIFLVQGSVIGLSGTVLGMIGGLILSSNIASIMDFIEKLFHIKLYDPSPYLFIDTLPSQIQATDIIQVCSLALLMSLLATLYPAWRAARIAPAKALRYE